MYCIIASRDPNYGENDNVLHIAWVWVSELALLVRSREQQGVLDGFVLKALTGEPVAGAVVKFWVSDGAEQWKPAGESRADENGMFRFVGGAGQVLLRAEYNGHAIASRLDYETQQAVDKLARMQLGGGLRSWFAGCAGDEYIALYIMTGFGRLRHLVVRDIDMRLALKSLDALDEWIERKYRDILKNTANPAEYVPSYSHAFYLYGWSFFSSRTGR